MKTLSATLSGHCDVLYSRLSFIETEVKDMMTWKQYYVDFAVLYIRDGGRACDVATILSVAPAMVYALLKSRGFNLKELKRMPPLPQKERRRILNEFCREKANSESLCLVLELNNIRLEDFLEQPLSSFSEHLPNERRQNKRVLSDRDMEIAELRRKGTTLRAIGLKYGITRERVRQIVLLYNRHSSNPVDIENARILGYRPSPEKIARQNKIVELCQQGLTYQQIADSLGIEKKYVFQDLARYNHSAKRSVRARREENRKVTDKVREGIIRERKNGTTNYAIAAQYDVSYGTICRVIKEAGLTRPHRNSKKVKRTKVVKKKASKR